MSIKEILQQLNLKPSQTRGQNFLIDANILNKIIASADLKAGDRVLEVGPGLGALTGKLVDSGATVLSCELDKKLFAYLLQKYSGVKNLILLNNDILKLPFPEIKKHFQNKDYQIVANLPYSISSAFLRRFLECDYCPRKMILMLQKEVCQRLLDAPPQMSLLSLSVQLYSRPKILFSVSKNSFYPAPKVDSAVIELTQIRRPQCDESRFWQIAKAGFSAKRKKLIGNLAKIGIKKENLSAIFSRLNLSENIRAQELSLDDWLNLTGELI